MNVAEMKENIEQGNAIIGNISDIKEAIGEVDGVVEVVEVVRNSVPAMALFFAGGLSLGVGVGYFVATKLLSKKFDEQLEAEIEETREFYAGLNKVDDSGKVVTPMEALLDRQGAEAVEAVREYQGRSIIVEDGVLPPATASDILEDEEQLVKTQMRVREISVVAEEPDPKTGVQPIAVKPHNIFTDDNFDVEEEKQYRTADEPYIVTKDEFYANDPENDQQDLTYFEVDSVLCDERDKAIEDVNGIVGDANMARFGSGSGDRNKVYIRNERLGIDYEVTRSKGSYLEEVLGMAEEDPNSLKHSDQRDRRRAMRED